MDILAVKRDFLRELARIMAKMDDREQFFNLLTALVAETFGVSWASLALLDEDRGQYRLKASARREERAAQKGRLSAMINVSPWLKDRQRILSQRLLDEFGTRMDSQLKDELNQSETSVSMPLFAQEKLIGVLNLGVKADGAAFGQEEVEMFAELAELLAAIVQQAIEHHRVREQRLHHQNILDNLVSGIVAIDPEDKITVFNRAAERITGFKSDELLGQDVRILQANLANLLLDTLHQGKSYRREELYILPENTLIGVSTSQFYDGKGKLLGACMVFSGIAEIKRGERIARQKDQDAYWSNLADSLAHEVKNSLVAAKVLTEMFPQKYEDAEFRWNLYATLKRDMEKLDNFTDRVLNFAEPQELILQPCQIDQVVDSAIDAVFQESLVGEIALEKMYRQNLDTFTGDYHQLKEAFAQLLYNALEAMGKGGKLKISIEQENNPQMLVYSLPEAVKELPAAKILVAKITDTGCGISPQHLARVFDPFFTTKAGKSGLGLALVKKIIERHNGTIGVESSEGEGATFWVCLPVLSK